MDTCWSTKPLTLEKRTISLEGTVVEDYFQLDYFQSDYFQTGTLNISATTETDTVDLNPKRSTLRIIA